MTLGTSSLISYQSEMFRTEIPHLNTSLARSAREPRARAQSPRHGIIVTLNTIFNDRDSSSASSQVVPVAVNLSSDALGAFLDQ